MKNRLLSILLVLCMALTLLPETAWGASTDFIIKNGVLTKYQGHEATVKIPENVTSIGEWAFASCSSPTSITISKSVTSIENFAFNFCENLTKVTIPASVISIGAVAFNGCEKLADVYYGGSENQWKQISIHEYANYPLFKANIHYNSYGVSAGGKCGNNLTWSLSNGTLTITVNGTPIVWTDASPYIDINGRTMVPLRAVGDALGLTVDWNSTTREAIFTNGVKTIYFPIDKTTARTGDGQSIQMDTVAVLKGGRTYAPVRYLAEYFGFTVGWDGTTRTVSIL